MFNNKGNVRSQSNVLPPRSQTRSSSLRARTPRSSTANRALHRTLPSRSPSLNTNRRRQKSSSQRNSALRKSTFTSNISKNANTTNICSPINSIQSDEMLSINDNDDKELEMNCDIVDVQELSSGNQSVKENIIPSKYPFEIDKNYTIKQATASGKKLANEVYELYEQQSNGTYRCTLCADKVKIIKQTGRGTANLRSHLITHGLKKYAFDSQEEQRTLRSDEVSANVMPPSRKSQLDQAILQCIIDAGLPFNLFNHDCMIKLLNLLEPGYKPPDRGTLSSRIHEQYYRHILDLKSVLPHVGPIAFTSDLWKDISQQHIISLSLHTFASDFEFISLPLSFHRFQEQKLASNIQAFFEYERERFGLGTRILAGITTDNGPDIKCAGASGVLGPRLACLAHCLNLVVHHATCLWRKPNPKRFPFDTMHEQISAPLVDDDDDELTTEDLPYPSSSSGENETDSFQYNTQQSVDYFAFPFVEESTPSEKPILNEDIFDLLIRIHHFIQKVRTFVTMARLLGALQRYVYERIDRKKGAFILDSKIRWNSTFKMLDRVINNRDLVDEIFTKRDINGLTTEQKVKLRSLSITYDDWELLNALRDCLLPFEKVTTILSGDYTTQALSYYALQSLKENLYQTSHSSYYHAIINKSLSYQYEYYLDEFLPSDQKLMMKVAAFLDPLFHGDLMLNKKDYETAKCVVMADMQHIKLTSSDISTAASSSTSILSTTSTANMMVEFKSSLMDITKKKTNIPLSLQPINPDLEMATFLNLVRTNESINFQSFWKTNCRALSRLSQLVRRYNIVPATSVYLEQTFSVAGAIKNVRKASMSSLSLRSLMILKKKRNIEKLRSFSQ